MKGDHVTQRTVYLDCEMHHALYEKWEICEKWIGTVTIMNSHLYPARNSLAAATCLSSTLTYVSLLFFLS